MYIHKKNSLRSFDNLYKNKIVLRKVNFCISEKKMKDNKEY